MSERCPACFNFQRFCSCAVVREAERLALGEYVPFNRFRFDAPAIRFADYESIFRRWRHLPWDDEDEIP